MHYLSKRRLRGPTKIEIHVSRSNVINVLGEFILSVCAAQMSGKKLLRYKHEGLGKRRIQQINFWELD